jgi:3-isopropylmalate dehydrogenase
MIDRDASSSAATPNLTQCIPGWKPRASGAPYVVGVLPGEGIGPEVVDAALLVLDAVTRARGIAFEIRRATEFGVGGRHRSWLAEEGVEFCRSIFAAEGALLCGPMGGRSVYDLRERFDLYCKLVPLRPSPALADVAIVRPERLEEVDVLIVRENLGGLYAGEFGRREAGRIAYQSFEYHADQIERIVRAAARLATARRGRLAMVGKAGGVPEVSALWREMTEAVASDHGIDADILEIDNASFQLVANPRRFDVVVAPNFLGDILADAATVLLGSRGMSYSANYGPEARAAYQTGHGAAHDLAGIGRANPVAQILSAAMMLRESFGLAEEAACIETAIENVLASGVRTADVAGAASRVLGTSELAEWIAQEAAGRASESREIA